MRQIETGWRRVAALGVLAAALLVLVVLVAPRDAYTLRAEFTNAGGVVRGGEVRVSGRRVGGIGDIELTDGGYALVELNITDEDVEPLPAGTRARIRAIGQAGVANHYVDLTPGPAGEGELDDGATLPLAQTDSIVSLDAVLSSLDEPARASIREVIGRNAQIYAGSGSEYFNGMLAQLSPALHEIQGLSGQLASDKANIARLIDRAAVASQAVAARRPDLQSAVANTATTMRALASEREALGDLLVRAPDVLRQAGETFDAAETAVEALRPALRQVPAAARPLGTVLDRLPPALGKTVPVLRQTEAQLPGLRRSLAAFEPMARTTVPALRATARATRDLVPILAGLRPYGSDLVLGIFNGLVGISTGPYDHDGHYVHLEFTQSPQFLLGGAAGPLFGDRPLVPGLFALRKSADARCPGSNHPPAPDESSPWIPDPSVCDADTNQPAWINEP